MKEPGAEPFLPQRPTLAKLRAAVDECRGCELWEHATQGVMGRGPASAELMLVGEQPGDREDLEGEPFVGPAGGLLDRALTDAGIDPEQVYRTNAVKHFRFSGTSGKRRIHQSPARRHVLACEPWLVTELELVEPAGVVLLGATAAEAVMGTSFRLSRSRGRVLDWPERVDGRGGKPEFVVATAHPAAVLRSRHRSEALAELVHDLRVAARALRQAS
ncbi:MAG: UdgX family uracil-DNA binding protein [Nocardioidaceae bacterium]|nr:UdgX family uracil-DNA binding protein [Nocardioidaceae bacterium]